MNNVHYFNTGDYDAVNGLITAIASDGEYYKFANYFGIFFNAGSVSVDGYSGNQVLYIDSISITKTAGMEVGESYTFGFNEGEVNSYTANSTASTDGEGNTFYPLHAVNGADSTVTQENITAKIDADGNTETVGTLKVSTNGITQYIPTDKNGLPFVLEPNTKYSVQIKGYAQYVSKEGQLFFGGGIFNADYQDYYMLHSQYNNINSWYYVDGTNNGSANTAMYAAYPMFRTSSYLHNSSGGNMYTSDTATTVLRYYDDFDKTRTAQYSDASRVFTTSDFTETYSDTVNDTNGNNVFETDLWQWYKWAKKTDPAITDPYSDEAVEAGVEVKTETVGAYFGIFCDGGLITGYYDDGTGTRVATAAQNTTFYIDSITITKVSQTASVTYDANGGTFSDSTTTKTVTENVGGEFTVAEPSYSNDTKVFAGWSLSANSKIAVKDVDASLHGRTLYAIWGDPNPHPDDGVYDTWTRTIEFDKYTVSGSENTFIPTSESYGEYAGVPYFEVIDDPDEEGDSVLHYYNHSKASKWYANWTITPTESGKSTSDTSSENCNVLPAGSTFKMTMRLRINDDDGCSPAVAILYGTTNGRNTYTDGTNASGYTVLKSGLSESEEWQEVVTYFTTPEEYTTVTNGVANRLYVGINCAGYKVDYDLDYIKLEKVTNVNLYADSGNGYVLQETLVDVPGTALSIPGYYSAETYSLYDSTGSYSQMLYGNWFSNEDCTEAAVMKYGNYDVDLYCNNVTALPSAGTENQEIFVGFDTYTQRTEGLSGAVITDKDCYSGETSLMAEGNASFELKNDHTSVVAEGKTYRVDFMYKATADSTLGIGLANGLVANGVNVKNTVSLAAADDWTAASVCFDADGAQDNSVFAATLTSNGTVYIDAMIVSSATESVGVEATSADSGEALRFMLSYSGSDTVKLAGEDYTVTEHGVLVKGAENTAALDLDSTDAAGVYHFAQTDLSKNWSVNPITGTTVYSAYLEGFEADDDYKVSVRGYVKLSDGSVFYTDTLTASVSDIPAAADIIPETADLTDCYVYLPAGTTLPADADYTVTTFDSTFTANSAVASNTVTEDSYVLFSAMPDFDKINVPSELKYLVHAGAKADLYYGINSQIVSEQISSVGADTVNYLFVTDIHFGSSLTSAQNVCLLNQAKLMVKMANENDDIDFVVVGGDTTTGMYGSKESAVKWTQAALDPFLECTKPVFVLMGNHDDNSYHLLSGSNTNKELYEECVITDLDWQNYIIDRYVNKGNIQVVQDDADKRANSKYYYYDLEGKKTRVIALDALDYEARYDENGYVLGDLDGDGLLDGMPVKNADGTTDSAKYYSGCSYWGYSADQVRWLAEDALGTLPADYDVIFVSHMGMDITTNCYNSKIWFGENIREIIKAYNAGGTYTASLTDNWGDAVSVNADFSGKNGDILSWQFGHQHIEMSLYESDVDLWQLCSSSANVGQTGTQTYEKLAASSVNNKSLPWRVYTRKLGTATEACFNAMSVSSERVYRFTVGEGNNEKLVYSD